MHWTTHTISIPICGKRVYAVGSKPGIDATKKIPGEGFKRPWPPLIKMDAVVKAKVDKVLGSR